MWTGVALRGTIYAVVCKLVTLTAIDAGSTDDPPREICLLRAGVNGSTQGDAIFDAEAAEQTVASWRVHSVGTKRAGMIDLEHLSLDPEAKHFDPDARAWYEIELRGGEAWLTDIDWTPDGDRRVRNKTQRFLSPAAYQDEDGRIVEILNVALTALPSLHGAPQLIASRVHERLVTMAATDSAAQMPAVLKALGLDPKMIDKVAVALGLEAGASIEEIRAALDSFDSKMTKVGELLSGDEPAVEAAAAAPDAAPAPMAQPAAPPPEEEQPVAQMRRERDDAITALRAIEDRERKTIVASMVAGGHESPATAWADPTATADAQTPAEPWASMPLIALRARSAALSATAPAPAQITAPVSNVSAEGDLTPAQIAICKQHDIAPDDYKTMRARAGRNR